MSRTTVLSATLCLLALPLCALVPPASAKVLEVGKGKAYAAPSDAIAAAQDGDTVRIDAGEYYDCATVTASHVTIEGTGPDATAVLTDKVCSGKALLITNGKDITIRNLTLQRARVPDRNGAGIRAQGGNLTIDHVKFINNENGILAGDLPEANILIRDSEFLRNGVCAAACAHGIYINHVASLTIERSKFYGTKEGHHIKSRGHRLVVIGCDIADGPDGTSSYAIEASNGGTVIVRDNHIEKGPKSENHTGAVVIGLGGVDQPTPEIVVENNRFTVDGGYSSYLVVNRTATEAMLKGNVLLGGAKALDGDGQVK